jgi:hypothetical protein
MVSEAGILLHLEPGAGLCNLGNIGWGEQKKELRCVCLCVYVGIDDGVRKYANDYGLGITEDRRRQPV